MQNQIVQESLRDITPGFQQSGLLDSGVRASISARTAADLRRATEEFNIGAKQNLLNLALSGQAQVQQPILGFSGQLGSRLAGLRTVTESSQMTSTSRQNPSMMSNISQGIGMAGSMKLIMACIPEGELIDAPDEEIDVCHLKAGDTIYDGYGNEVTVQMVYQFNEPASDDRFFKLYLDSGLTVMACDLHRIDDKLMKDIQPGDYVSGFKVVKKVPHSVSGRTFDIMTDAPDGSYRISGVRVNTMIPELQAKTQEAIKGVCHG